MSEEFAGRTIRPELIQAVGEAVYSASGHPMDFAGRAVLKIRVDRRTVAQTVLIARHFQRDLLLGDDAMLNLQINISTYPQRAVSIEGHAIPFKLGRVVTGCDAVCDISTRIPVQIPARREAEITLPLPQHGPDKTMIQDGDLVVVEPLRCGSEAMDVMIPRSFTRVENGSVTVTVLNPMRLKTELPASLPLIRVERVNPTIASIEVPRAADVRPLEVTPELRQEMVARLRKELNEGAPIPSIPGASWDEADLTPEENQLFSLALHSVLEVFATTDLELGVTTLVKQQIYWGCRTIATASISRTFPIARRD